MKKQLIPFRNVLLIGLLIVLSFTISCKKADNEPTMPPYTETGAGTFACKIDGKVWITGSDEFGGHATCSGSYSKMNNEYLGMQASYDQDALNEFIRLEVHNVKGLGKYILSKEVNNGEAYYSTNLNGSKKAYIMLPNQTGVIELKKLDTVNNIISGTFYFDGTDSITGKVAHITDGIFDIHWK